MTAIERAVSHNPGVVPSPSDELPPDLPFPAVGATRKIEDSLYGGTSGRREEVMSFSEEQALTEVSHLIDSMTAGLPDPGGFTKTEFATLVIVATLQGKCDALEDRLLVENALARGEYVRIIRRIAEQLLGG